jgi:small subunit ribosomal protein S11
VAKEKDTRRDKGAKKKEKRIVTKGIAHVQATFNNTIVTITDMQGAVVSWSSGGKLGFKGARKSTAYAAQLVAEDCGKVAQTVGMKELEVNVNGPGNGRESAIRAFSAIGMSISVIRDKTSVPHNGCRSRKPRRV